MTPWRVIGAAGVLGAIAALWVVDVTPTSWPMSAAGLVGVAVALERAATNLPTGGVR